MQGIKRGITHNPRNASSVRPDASRRLFTLQAYACSEGHVLLLSTWSDFPIGTLSALRGAERHAIRVVRVVVVLVAVVVDIRKVRGVGRPRRAQPPVVG